MPDSAIRQTITGARRIVVKIGSSAVTDDAGRLDRRVIAALARQVATAMDGGASVTLVASGAIAAGICELQLPARPKTMPQLQAVAAVGQGQLIRAFHDAFAKHGVKVAQVLLTRDAFEDRTRYLNIRNTLGALDECGALAIINENDTVAIDEIRFGDNDVLAALVCNMLGADLLVFLTNVDGILRDGEVLDVIEKVDDEAIALASPARSQWGAGGMESKLASASLAARGGGAVVIANSRTPNVITRLLAGRRVGTIFVPAGRRMSSRRRWIGHASRATGKIVIDDGAARALLQRGKSLLPSGIVAVAGRFDKGATVSVIDSSGRQLARGLTNYSADQIDRIKGLRSSQIAATLGDKPYDEVIHRNNMTMG